MLRWMATALLAVTPAAQADTKPVETALEAAMGGLFVVVPTDPATGASMMAKLPGENGRPDREVVVAFLDAGDAAATVLAAGMGPKAEGRLFNAAELLAVAGGDVIWRTSPEIAALVNGEPTRPPAFYITNPDGDPLTQVIEGKAQTVFYVDALAADSARVATQNELSAAGQPMDLKVIAADFGSVVQAVTSGESKDVFFATSPTVIIWAAQWEQGKRLIGNYKPK